MHEKKYKNAMGDSRRFYGAILYVEVSFSGFNFCWFAAAEVTSPFE
jgi:hypothetical protein